jgi:DUF177 domain-containing protein
MRIRLDQIADEPFLWEETLSIPVAEVERTELVALGEVALRGELRRTEPGLLLKGRVRYRQTLTCDRCLSPFSAPVDALIELWIQPERRQEVAPEQELEEADFGVLYVAGEDLDTAPLLREQLQLNIPMKPLCRPDCVGLCPQCGADLNQDACQCAGPGTDPRWSALADLRSHLD